MTGDRALTHPLTDEEKALVERYHNIIYTVMNDMRLPHKKQDDLYGDGALALMAAARQYQTQSRLQKYSFATIAYISIRRAYANNIRAKKKFETISLDAEIGDTGFTLYNITPAPDYTPENSEETLKAYSRVKELLTEKEYVCVELYALGLPIREIEQYHNTSRGAYNDAIWRAREKCFVHYGEIFDTTDTAEIPEKKKQRSVSEDEHAEIIRLFNEEMSMQQIGRMLGRNTSVVRRHVKKFRQAAT